MFIARKLSGILSPVGISLSAPALGFPTPQQAYTSPAAVTVGVTVGGDWAYGDAILLYKSASPTMSSPTLVGTHTFGAGDTPGVSINIGVGTLSSIWYFQAVGQVGGVNSIYSSNVVGWGSSTAPTITTSATQSHNELTQYAVAITANVPISTLATAVWFSGGADQSLFELFQDTSGNWSYRPYANGTFDADNPTSFGGTNAYSLQITLTSIFGNTAAINITDTIQHVSKTVTLTPSDFGSISNATDGTVYTLPNTCVVSGLASGISVAMNCSGTGFTYSKNGGAFTNASTTVTNGDSLNMKGSTSGGAAVGTLTFAPSTPYTVTATGTVADNAVLLSATNYYQGSPLGNDPMTFPTGQLSFQSYTASANHQMASCDTPKSGSIRQWEVTFTSAASGGAQPAFGMYPGTVNFNVNSSPGSPEPGRTGQPSGFFFCFNNNGTTYFSDYDAATAGSGSWTYAAGDTVTIIWDSVGHTIKVGIYKAGVWHLLATATGVTDATLCPYVGADGNLAAGTVNFGASAFNYPLSSTPGAAAYNT